MNPITLPMAELKPALAGLGKIITRRPTRFANDRQFPVEQLDRMLAFISAHFAQLVDKPAASFAPPPTVALPHL